jgi:hypothetical protein
MPNRPYLVAVTLLVTIGIAIVPALTQLSAAENVDHLETPDFSRDIRPILSNHCFACHGPDEQTRKADLRLDTAEGLSNVVNADEASKSELLSRVSSTDPDLLMPPPEFHKPLASSQRELLERWLNSGAAIKQHWSFRSPIQPNLPNDIAGNSPASIDYLINQRARAVGLKLNTRTDRRTLIRRVCLDLTGLPPTREQIAEFLSDESPEAYETLVDRLLSSAEFGRHVGRYWLDLVRYADTHGLHLDNYREMWPYRDWVIQAINDNMPFNEFMTLQLAGDLLPNAEQSDRVASGFNRLNVTTGEGGSIYDEVFARNVIDRTDAFGTIFLGLTTGCAVCHDHKFDPISMEDYYSLFSFFNSLDGRALDANIKNPAPVIPVPTTEQKQQIGEFKGTLIDLQQRMVNPIATVDAAQRGWEQALVKGIEPKIEVLMPASVNSEAGTEMDISEDGSFEFNSPPAAKDITTIVAPLTSGTQWQTLHLEALVDEVHNRVGAAANGNAVLSEISVEITDDFLEGQWLKVPITYGFADFEQQDGSFSIRQAFDSKVNDSTGWAVGGHQKTGGRSAWFVLPALMAEGTNAKIRVRLQYQSKFEAHHLRRVRLSVSDMSPKVPVDQRITLSPLSAAGPFTVESAIAAYGRKYASQQSEFKPDQVFNHEDRPYRWQERADLTEVQIQNLPTVQDRSSVMVLHQRLSAPNATKITLLFGTDGGHAVYLNGKQIAISREKQELNPLALEYELDLKQGENDLYMKVVNYSPPSRLTFAFRSPAIDTPRQLNRLLNVADETRSEEDRVSLRNFYRKVHCLHPDWLALVDQEKGVRKALKKLNDSVSTTLVWKELAKPRQAHVLIRGQYDQSGKPVPRATPAFLPAMPVNAPANRLGLAQWLALENHPLTARVAVNRYWQQIFGVGLVKTSEDFGSQGEPPSHPELLDLLAVDFQTHGWNVKRMLKALVMTDAYARSSKVSPSAQKIDPENRLLARGPRHRLDAEVLRDQALFVAGLLTDHPGGPSVKPPQPDGLWKAVGYSGSNTVRFTPDNGEKIYRRSVFTFWKRTSPPPQMSTFDAPSRESCTARRERTNTPLQALLLMNETQYVESAHKLALRVLNQEEIKRLPKTERLAARIDLLYETVTSRLPSKTEQAEIASLLTDLIAYYSDQPTLTAKLSKNTDPTEAAWTILASTVLNLDEVVSK